MKTILFFVLAATIMIGQTAYSVVPGTNGNQIVLSVVNESENQNVEKIIVILTNHPAGIDLQNKVVELLDLRPQEERDAVFIFDVKRNPVKEKDTLKFLIKDNNGGKWNKEVVVQYSLPTEFKLEQNYPNPFNPSTVISYQLPAFSHVTLKVYDILGREVAALVDEHKQAGIYKVTFEPASGSLKGKAGFKNPASGIYFYRLQAGSFTQAKKMILEK